MKHLCKKNTHFLFLNSLSNIDKSNEGRYICNVHAPGSERPMDRDFIDLIVRGKKLVD